MRINKEIAGAIVGIIVVALLWVYIRVIKNQNGISIPLIIVSVILFFIFFVVGRSLGFIELRISRK